MASNDKPGVELEENIKDKRVPPTYVIDPVEEKKVVRKLDRVILPLMAFVYFFQYLDKQSINYAAVFGLKKDLGLSGADFSWAVSLFYFGQLFSQYPAAYLMSRVRITSFVGVTVILWGAAEMCLAATQDFKSLAAVRFLLGFFEGAVSPSFVIITSNWYCQREHPVRVATWVSMFGVAQIVGALMMYGVSSADLSIQTWRVMFLICGGLTVLGGLLFTFLMPRDSTTAWFLNDRERQIATERLALDRATRDQTSFNWAQAKEAVTDIRTLMYALMALFITLPTAILKFSSLVIEGFGFSAFETMLVGLPTGAVAFILCWVGALVPLHWPNTRCFTGIFLAAMPMLGSLLLLALPASSNWGIVVSTWFASCNSPALSNAVGLMASNVRGNTKKSVVGAIFFVMYCVGCIVSPQLWTAADAPRYFKGCVTSVVSLGLLGVSLGVFYATARWSNARRERGARAGEGEDGVGAGAGLDVDADLTEKQDRGFRYTY
ncbi:MFS general substrate transporter [Aspergillus steynii IBT 23096]|uniref:MFS general substrate transporter n=1 Tax=Aspergillus steynii IBT 23096 TaxID=1392250 RepID=A0A2I2G1A4_9EURO|nr:MFS general substrate transporter [Aspergillus steynii IBT 23096]PLB46649.1 MFS general substrate transporter [Aspergillus steynii IBT 23096]